VFCLRSYIFTEIERKLIERYIESGVKVQDFYVLLNRIRANYSTLKDDMKQLETVLEKEIKLR